jgi:hypothetical protein
MFRPLQAILKCQIQSFLEAIIPTWCAFLGYTVYYFKPCYVIYYNLKFDVKITDNVLKIDILYTNVVSLKLAKQK